jgi:hypothetical protein
MTDEEILLTRRRLQDYFRRRAHETAISIDPVPDDDRSVVLLRRLYEEDDGQRIFTVNTSNLDDERELEWFFKARGLQFEKQAVALITNSDERRFGVLWDAYVKWMHEGATERTVEDLLQHSA